MISMVVIIMIVIVMVVMFTSMVTVAVTMTVAMAPVIMAAMGMDLAVKMFRLAPYQRRTNGRLDSDASTILQAPLENTAEQSVHCIVFRTSFEICIKTPMAFNRYQRTEIELSSFEGFSPTSMGTMCLNRGGWY